MLQSQPTSVSCESVEYCQGTTHLVRGRITLVVMLHLGRDANTGFPAGYRNQMEVIRANRTVQFAI